MVRWEKNHEKRNPAHDAALNKPEMSSTRRSFIVGAETLSILFTRRKMDVTHDVLSVSFGGILGRSSAPSGFVGDDSP